VEVFVNLPLFWILCLGNIHNENAAVHKPVTFPERMIQLRELFIKNDRVWSPEAKAIAMETLGYRDAESSKKKSVNEFFQLTGVSSELWGFYLQLLTGKYIKCTVVNQVIPFPLSFSCLFFFSFFSFFFLFLFLFFYCFFFLIYYYHLANNQYKLL
jgi:hypothetical protein